MKYVFVLFGESGSGKSTLSKHLMAQAAQGSFEQINHGATFNFADKVKEVTHEVFGIPKEILWGTKEQKDTYVHEGSGKTARFLMQWVGQTFREGPGGTTVWVDALINDVIASDAKLICIGDGRHPQDELLYFSEELEKKGIKTFGVRLRPGYEGYKGFEGEYAAHPSEANVAKADDSMFAAVILNNGTQEQFEKNGTELVQQFIRGD